MPLSNSQYDEILREYDARQLENKRLLDSRKKKAYEAAPSLKEIDRSIAEYSVASARRLLDGEDGALKDLKAELSSLRKKRGQLLEELGYPADYFEPVYTCPDCRDTGYQNGARCHCLTQRMIDTVYTRSNLKEILASENFDTFSFEYYSDTALNPATGMTSLETAKAAYRLCKNFAADFDRIFSNLCFYGDTGTGKTFLSNCVAKELLDTGHSVIYFTAFQLFEMLGKGIFDKERQAIASHRNIFDCDLLIIDDLGTELANSFTTSQLFLCLNERMLRKKSTIISTNLNMSQIADIYSERVLSRISSSYTIIKLFGDDIRMKKRMH